MSRTITRDIIKVCAELARMDRKAKIEVFEYLHDELKQGLLRETAAKLIPPKMVADKEGEA